MDIDYLLIILPGIVFLGFLGLILVIWQYGDFRSKKEDEDDDKILSTMPSKNLYKTIPHYSSREEEEASILDKSMSEINIKETSANGTESLIILHLLAAEERPYAGYELVQTLSSAGFYYGAMNIFHYYEDQNEKSARLFSLASAVEPGTFDLTHIAEILAPGLCLFMSLKDKNALANFELMLETAQLLIQDLGGQLCDGQRQPLTDYVLTHYRSKLYSYA
ncbi:cell division protein ZipA [Candidatus Rickettsiella viridis]|uniref:Cell division protein ZipA n=1 Tax=Candidatus Rickettsiella viridis TaxID=676208 RepID=A0A2Z5UU56_9COXI|nr:cell division protein ZipA [Candidatus Rickettsiella viridis]BBB15008.1 cell division protein ZipA [Candidatus Rickettsiella viridis]